MDSYASDTMMVLVNGAFSVPGHLWMALLALSVVLILYRCVMAEPSRATARHLVKGVLFPYGVHYDIGLRSYMEDRHVVSAGVAGDRTQTLYAVFDGHGGSHAADFCALHMPRLVESAKDLRDDPVRALTAAFDLADHEFLHAAGKRLHPWDDGTTAVAALVRGLDVWVANAGDSRAVLVRSDGPCEPLSHDHKPNRPDEWERIVQQGGTVTHHGVWRVQGVLAVSRAIGDRLLKPLVPGTPEVIAHRIEEGDAFLILATDGLWDVMSNEEAAARIRACASPHAAATALVREALVRGSADNVTALVVDLRDAVRLAAEAAALARGPAGRSDVVPAGDDDDWAAEDSPLVSSAGGRAERSGVESRAGPSAGSDGAAGQSLRPRSVPAHGREAGRASAAGLKAGRGMAPA